MHPVLPSLSAWFGDSLSTALHDQLVCGLFSEALQQNILGEADLTIARAVETAQAFETGAQETCLLRSGPAVQPPRRPILQQSETTHAVRKEATDGSFQRKWPSQDLRECYRCGDTGHHPANCRFKLNPAIIAREEVTLPECAARKGETRAQRQQPRLQPRLLSRRENPAVLIRSIKRKWVCCFRSQAKAE